MPFIVGDGRLGYPPKAPYDIIHVGAAAKEVPQPVRAQIWFIFFFNFITYCNILKSSIRFIANWSISLWRKIDNSCRSRFFQSDFSSDRQKKEWRNWTKGLNGRSICTTYWQATSTKILRVVQAPISEHFIIYSYEYSYYFVITFAVHKEIKICWQKNWLQMEYIYSINILNWSNT